MNPCPFTGCPGGHFKYDNCLIQALYLAYASMVGSATEECGSTEWSVYAWLIIESDTFTIPAGDWDGHADMTIAGPLYAIVTTNSDGAVFLVTYDTEREAQDAYDLIESAYGAWCEEQDK